MRLVITTNEGENPEDFRRLEIGANRNDFSTFIMLVNSVAKSLFPDKISIDEYITHMNLRLLDGYMTYLKEHVNASSESEGVTPEGQGT